MTKRTKWVEGQVQLYLYNQNGSEELQLSVQQLNTWLLQMTRTNNSFASL